MPHSVLMAVNRVRVTWQGVPTVGNGLSTFYFDSTVGTAAQQVAAVATFFSTTEARRSNQLQWFTETDVSTLNTATGDLEGITTVTQSSGIGTSAGDAMAPVIQGLLRLLTPTVFNGRLLRGRLFLPGVAEVDNQASGTPTSAYRSSYDAAAATLIADANSTWIVWSQTHDGFSAISAATVWAKWAILRSRRD